MSITIYRQPESSQSNKLKLDQNARSISCWQDDQGIKVKFTTNNIGGGTEFLVAFDAEDVTELIKLCANHLEEHKPKRVPTAEEVAEYIKAKL